MKATAEFIWQDGTKADFSCNYNNKIIDRAEDIARLVFFEGHQYWKSELKSMTLYLEGGISLPIYFDDTAGIIYVM